MDKERREYLTARATPARDRRLVAQLQDLYNGACQLCGWAPRSVYGCDICEGHHIRWLSRGGADELANLVLVCPNHHRAIHRIDAPFDFSVLSFVFQASSEPLLHSLHELTA
nr:HNH endonuclease signature motif containing protein [Pseudaminobacter soli]